MVKGRLFNPGEKPWFSLAAFPLPGFFGPPRVGEFNPGLPKSPLAYRVSNSWKALKTGNN